MVRTVQISGRRFELDDESVSRRLAGVLPEPVQTHFVVVDGRRFPPKQVISLVTGLDRADFTSHQARRVLLRLGFAAARRPRDDAGETVSRGDREQGEAPLVTLLRGHVDEWVAVKDEDVLVADRDISRVLGWLSRHELKADSLFRVPAEESGAGGAAPA